MTPLALDYFDSEPEAIEKASGILTIKKMQTKMGKTKESKGKLLHDVDHLKKSC